MESSINSDKKFSIIVRSSTRAKRMSIIVRGDGTVVGVKPVRTTLDRMRLFINAKKKWILKSLKKISTPRRFQSGVALPKHSKKEYAAYRKQAHALTVRKLEHFNKHYRFTYQKIFIKNQKTRWGSCSRRGNLNFNYKIIFLPEELQDYLIVHELCHLQEMNHGKGFWNLVGETIAGYKILRKRLKTYVWQQSDLDRLRQGGVQL